MKVVSLYCSILFASSFSSFSQSADSVSVSSRSIMLADTAVKPVKKYRMDAMLPGVPANATRFTTRQLRWPTVMIAAGVLSNFEFTSTVKEGIRNERNERMPHFDTNIDDYLQYSPHLITYGLDLLGVKAKTDVLNRTAILIKGQAMMLATVCLIKGTTKELRPDGSTYNSFPSGHTANAFAAATMLSEEYKDRLPWMPYAAYGIASGVGVLRIANNRHYISDVLLGAGIGFLAMKASYWTHRYAWGKKARTRSKLVDTL